MRYVNPFKLSSVCIPVTSPLSGAEISSFSQESGAVHEDKDRKDLIYNKSEFCYNENK